METGGSGGFYDGIRQFRGLKNYRYNFEVYLRSPTPYLYTESRTMILVTICSPVISHMLSAVENHGCGVLGQGSHRYLTLHAEPHTQRVPQFRGTFLGVRILRTIAF